jgi:hypothetical protein
MVSTRRQDGGDRRSEIVRNAPAAACGRCDGFVRPVAAADDPSWRNVVIDVVFVLLTVGLFAALGLLVRAVERL